MLIYTLIFQHARRPSRWIAPSTSNTPRDHMPNASHEMKLAQNTILIETLYAGTGTPLLLLLLWQAIQPSTPPPESFYFLSINSISVFVTLMIIMLFCTNKQAKDIVRKYLHCE